MLKRHSVQPRSPQAVDLRTNGVGGWLGVSGVREHKKGHKQVLHPSKQEGYTTMEAD